MDFDDIQRLQRLGPGSLDHLPPYAREAAVASIAKVKELEDSSLLRPGLYYIVLTDLSGASEASATLGATENAARIKNFVETTVLALRDMKLANSAFFVKDIGDASLFIFTAFPDVLAWHSRLLERLGQSNAALPASLTSPHLTFRAKTVVHVGEVGFNEKRDPVAEAVNQVFKVEKNFGPNELGCTDLVLGVAGPALRDAGIQATSVGEQVLPGHASPTRLWRLR